MYSEVRSREGFDHNPAEANRLQHVYKIEAFKEAISTISKEVTGGARIHDTMAIIDSANKLKDNVGRYEELLRGLNMASLDESLRHAIAGIDSDTAYRDFAAAFVDFCWAVEPDEHTSEHERDKSIATKARAIDQMKTALRRK